MFSRTLEYALRASVYLGSMYTRPVTAHQIADATCVPLSYLPKVLQQLVRAKLVKGTRGLHGGYILARDPASISVLDVVNAIEPLTRTEQCPLGLQEHREGLCPLHRRIDRILRDLQDRFERMSLAEILSEEGLPASWTNLPPEKTIE